MPAETVPPLIARLRSDHPAISFVQGDIEHWDAESTIHYSASSPDCLVLHELAHALLGHREYRFDIELLAIERAAWDYARSQLAPRYRIVIASDDVEDSLDTYRDWLHNRSLCPDCNLSGFQRTDLAYSCVACGCTWRANAAKTCALRRFRQPVAIP